MLCTTRMAVILQPGRCTASAPSFFQLSAVTPAFALPPLLFARLFSLQPPTRSASTLSDDENRSTKDELLSGVEIFFLELPSLLLGSGWFIIVMAFAYVQRILHL